jgi:hypothetical protein
MLLHQHPQAARGASAAYVSIRQHTSAYVSIRQRITCARSQAERVSIRQHTSAYVSIRQHTSAYVSVCGYLREEPGGEMGVSVCGGGCLLLVLILITAASAVLPRGTPAFYTTASAAACRQWCTSAYVSIRQHTSAYALTCFLHH